MPTGLDGNPNPLRSQARDELLRSVTSGVVARLDRRPLLVGVDGEAGAGKSTFADELAWLLRADGVDVVRASIDSFHRPRAERLLRDVDPAESYLTSSHDLPTLRRALLDPLRQGHGTFVTAAFDEPTDQALDMEPIDVTSSLVLVFDGLFLHRPELSGYWDLSVLLMDGGRARTSAAEGLARMLRPWPDGWLALARWATFAHRYVDGWRLYVERCRPAELATYVVENSDLAQPRFIEMTT